MGLICFIGAIVCLVPFLFLVWSLLAMMRQCDDEDEARGVGEGGSNGGQVPIL